MPRGYRGIVTAIGVIAALATAIGWFTFPIAPSLERFQYSQPRNEQYNPGGSACHPEALAAIRSAQVRINRAEDCEKKAEDYRQQSDDLIQQTRAANAAEAQTNIASQVLWMGWFQTIGGLLTLAAAVAAAIYARDAAFEGRRGADIAQQSHTAIVYSERAILRVQDVSLQEISGTTSIHIRLGNIGRSAAVVSVTTYVCTDNALFHNVGYLANEARHRVLVPPSGNDKPVCIGARPLAKNKVWFISGTVEYETILNRFTSAFSSRHEWIPDDNYGSGNYWYSQEYKSDAMPQDT